MKKENKQIYDDYLKKDRGAGEERRFASLFSDKNSEPELRDKMREEWEINSKDKGVDVNLDSILYKIHFLINSEKRARNKQGGSIRSIINWYSRVASIILLPALIVWSIFQFFPANEEAGTSLVKIVAPPGSRIQVELPDGSSGWLNSGSELEYNIPFEERHVALRGEAYFNIKSDSVHTFDVEGQNGIVRVFGTRFNVKMWPDDPITEVVLEEGKVNLIAKGTNENFEITPGEILVFNNENNTLSREFVNPKLYSGWIDGKLLFRGDRLEEVADKLSRWFNVDVEVSDTSLLDYTFRATFEDESLEEVLRLLKQSSPIDFEIRDHQQDSSGVYSRRKVIVKHE
jgi:transmembrane sensor